MPIVKMIAGPNGSGKSTLTRELERLGIPLGTYLNADDVASNMTGDPRVAAAAAQQWVRDRRSAALNDRLDHSFETVMSHPSHIDHLIAARAAGFTTRLFFVATDDPFEKIAERYHRCLANLPAAIAASDEGLIFNNSGMNQPLNPFLRIAEGEVFLHPEPQNRAQMANWMRLSPQWWQNYMHANELQLSVYRKIVPL